MILGFAEDYRKIVVNMRHELILTRSNSDFNAILQTGDKEHKIKIEKLEWLMPHLVLADTRKIKLLKFIEKDTPITMGFRSWDLYEYPTLPTTSKHVWTVKTSNQLEKPRYVILGFQTGRNCQPGKDASHFDHCKITNVKLFLNSESYPHGNMNIDVDQNKYSILYEMFTNFQLSYYEKEYVESVLTRKEFLEKAPVIVLDCSRQNETIKYGPVDVRLEFESKENLGEKTFMTLGCEHFVIQQPWSISLTSRHSNYRQTSSQ